MNTTEKMSKRELAIFKMAADGFTIKQIASVFGISPRTVEVHLYNSRKKMGARNTTHLNTILTGGMTDAAKEKFRWETAASIMSALYSGSPNILYPQNAAEISVKAADTLMNELMKGRETIKTNQHEVDADCQAAG